MRIRLALSPFLLLLQLPVTERFVAVDNVCAWPNLTVLVARSADHGN